MTRLTGDAQQAARSRRTAGTMADFDGQRLNLARRLAGQSRASLARTIEVSAAAVTQYEKGVTRPTLPVLQLMSLALGVPQDFFRAGRQAVSIPAASAHFRSLRSTTALARNQALAFAELSADIAQLLEQYVDFPEPALPDLRVEEPLTTDGIEAAAVETRRLLGLGNGPIPHVVRLLEEHGVLVLRMAERFSNQRVDAFSTSEAWRPVIILSPLKDDKARSRFDAAHELGHLLLHHDTEPGSQILERQADAFAAAFLMPKAAAIRVLPRRVDWSALHAVKRSWQMSLRSLVYRQHSLGLISTAAYKRAFQQLSIWGYPEPGPLGPAEMPSLLGSALKLLIAEGFDLNEIAASAHFTYAQMTLVTDAATTRRPRIITS